MKAIVKTTLPSVFAVSLPTNANKKTDATSESIIWFTVLALPCVGPLNHPVWASAEQIDKTKAGTPAKDLVDDSPT